MMKIHFVVFAIILSFYCLVNVEAHAKQRKCRPQGRSLAIYNTYMLDGYERHERLRKLIRALDREDADVYCLNEVWFEADMRKVIEKLSNKYHSSWSLVHSDEGSLRRKPHQPPQSACDVTDMYSLLQCVQTACSNTTNYYEFAACVVTQCPYASFVGPRCQEALVLQCASYSDMDQVMACALGLTNSSNDVSQTWLDPSQPIPATAGLLMLSKKPMSNLRRGLYYDTGVFPRGYLSAGIDGYGEVVCTHLTSNIGDVYQDITSGFQSYEEQNAYELNILMESYNHDLIIMGDLNFSPSIPERDIVGEFPAQWNTLLANDFVSLTDSLKACTFCVGNYIFDDQGFTESMILDHIVLKNNSTKPVSGVSIVFNQCPDDPISDHYGVKVLLD